MATKTAKKKAAEPEGPTRTELERQAAVVCTVDNTTVQVPATDPIQGGMVSVVAGEFQGRYGSFVKVLTADPDRPNTPLTILVKTRDSDHAEITVNYGDCVKAQAGLR